MAASYSWRPASPVASFSKTPANSSRSDLGLEGLPGVELGGIVQGEAGQEVGGVEIGRFRQRGQAGVARPVRRVAVRGDLGEQLVEATDVHPQPRPRRSLT